MTPPKANPMGKREAAMKSIPSRNRYKTRTPPAPAGIQPTLYLEPPYIAGLYTCEATNAVGSTLHKPYRLSVTKTASAPAMQVTLKQP